MEEPSIIMTIRRLLFYTASFFSLSLVWISGYNVILLPGSHIPSRRYAKIVEHLQSNLGNDSRVHVETYKPFRREYPNDTVLVGHSFGGSMALWDANKPNVKAVVLLYSHFNHRGKMWYPRTDMNSIRPPVLTILGTKDQRLPFPRAIDDLFYKQDVGACPNKHFLVKPWYNHFSGLDDDEEQATCLANDIALFLRDTHAYDNARQERAFQWYTASSVIPMGRDLSQSLHFLDALLMTAGFPGWWHAHFFAFLLSKPGRYENFQFQIGDSILYKTYNVPKDRFYEFLKRDVFPHIDIEWREITLPSIHPAIFPWLLREPRLVPVDRPRRCPWRGEVIVLPINENVTYYRVPTRRPLLANVSSSL